MKKDKNTEQNSVKDRLIEFLKYKDISQGAFEKECGLSNGYINNIRKSISDKTFNKIHDKFPELNKYWLLFNDGEMLKAGRDINNETLIGDKSVLAKNSNFKNSDFSGDVYKDSSAEIKALKKENENLKDKIKLLEEHLKSKEEHLKSKEEVIELLKSR